jgi:sigma-E factor negative regulatory protein RseC
MDLLKHTGVVKEITPTSLIVSIINQSACSACHAKGACSISDTQQKEIEITSYRNHYEPGSHVTVIFRESSGFKALLLGYILPFILLVTVLIVAIEITGNEITGAFISLGILVPYYIILYLSKDKLRKAFTFELEET